MTAIRRLILLDELIETKIGHYYEYDKSVMEAFKNRQIPCVLYTRDALSNDIRQELQTKNAFQYNPKSAVRKLKFIGPFLYRFRQWRQLQQQIRQVLRSEGQEPGTVFFIPNIFWFNLWPFAAAFGQTQHPVFLLYRTALSDTIDVSPLFKPFIHHLYKAAFRRLSKNRQVHFLTDSDVIATEFRQLYHHPMTVVPIPHVVEMDSPDFALMPDRFRFYLPGGARIEKGIATITEAIELLQQHHLEVMTRMTLVTQFFGEKEKELLEPLQKRLQALSCETVFLGKLDSDAYQHEMKAAHILLIPYLNSRGYQARTSGVLAEAIAAGKPFITSRDSWMDMQVKQYETGLAIQDTSAQELAEAMLQMMYDYPAYQQRAKLAKGAWLRFHSKFNFTEILIQALQSSSAR